VMYDEFGEVGDAGGSCSTSCNELLCKYSADGTRGHPGLRSSRDVPAQSGPARLALRQDHCNHEIHPQSLERYLLIFIDHQPLSTASPRSLQNLTMLIPKADRKAIHELVFLHTN